MPVRAVFGVGKLGVEAHDGGEKLGDEEDGESGGKFGVDCLERERSGRRCFALFSTTQPFNLEAWPSGRETRMYLRLSIGHCCHYDAYSKHRNAKNCLLSAFGLQLSLLGKYSPCTLVYLFPQAKPTSIVMMLPPLRKMIWTGTEMLYPKAKLFSRFTAKNMHIFGIHLTSGTFRFRRKKGGCLTEKCVGHVRSAVILNWTKVMRRPSVCQTPAFPACTCQAYRCLVPPYDSN